MPLESLEKKETLYNLKKNVFEEFLVYTRFIFNNLNYRLKKKLSEILS